MSTPSGFLNGTMVTVKNRTVSGQDGYGDDVPAATRQPRSARCAIQQSGSREDVSFTDQVITGVVVYMPKGTDIEFIDAMIDDDVRVRGQPRNRSHGVSPFTGTTAPVAVRWPT